MMPTLNDASVLERQIGRAPRTPWRVASRCRWGHPTVIVSPAMLDDGTRFPDYAWLTCPSAVGIAAARESRGEAVLWRERLAADASLADRMRALDEQVRALRAMESGDLDPSAEVGIAGQRDSLKVKCLHAHVALALLGLDDPIGRDVFGEAPVECEDQRCSKVVEAEERA